MSRMRWKSIGLPEGSRVKKLGTKCSGRLPTTLSSASQRPRSRLTTLVMPPGAPLAPLPARAQQHLARLHNWLQELWSLLYDLASPPSWVLPRSGPDLSRPRSSCPLVLPWHPACKSRATLGMTAQPAARAVGSSVENLRQPPLRVCTCLVSGLFAKAASCDLAAPESALLQTSSRLAWPWRADVQRHS